jgi:hypothetical protein
MNLSRRAITIIRLVSIMLDLVILRDTIEKRRAAKH